MQPHVSCFITAFMALHYSFTAQSLIEQGRVTREQIDKFKDWLETQDYPELTEEQVVLFLLSCNCEEGLTKVTVKAHFACKLNVKEFFYDRDVDLEDLQQQLKVVDFAAIPKRTPTGAAIIYFRIKKVPYYEFHIVPCAKLWFMALESLLHGQDPPTGLIILFDMDGLTLWHLTRMRLGPLKNFFVYLQEGLTIKLQKIEGLKTVNYVDKFLAFFKPFMKKEVYEMISLNYKDMDVREFYKKVPAECLPEEMGGDLGPIDTLVGKTIENLRAMKPFFDAEQKQWEDFKQKQRKK